MCYTYRQKGSFVHGMFHGRTKSEDEKRGNFMVGNPVSDQGKRAAFMVRKVIRWLLFLCIVLVFCPSFLVSCSGRDVNVSAMTAVKGVYMYGDTVVEPHPVMLVCLLLPLAALALLFIKKFSDQKTAGMVTACGIADFVVWLVFRFAVKKIADENYCSFRTTGWYALNLAAQLLIILFSVLAAIKKIEMEMDVMEFFASGKAQGTMSQMSKAVGQMSNAVGSLAGSVVDNMNQKKQKENAIGFCSKCGSPIAYGCRFCTSCGASVPEDMLVEAEAQKKAAEEAARLEAEVRRKAAEEAARLEAEVQREAAEEAVRLEAEAQKKAAEETACRMGRFCQNCGARLEPDVFFCQACGTKAE